jgi:hypothetical protein
VIAGPTGREHGQSALVPLHPPKGCRPRRPEPEWHLAAQVATSVLLVLLHLRYPFKNTVALRLGDGGQNGECQLADAVACHVSAEVPDLPSEEPPTLCEEPLSEPEDDARTPADRLPRWRPHLLDISGRNRLLNLRTAGKQALAIDCPEPAQLEDILAQMRSRAKAPSLRFRPRPDLMTGEDPRSATLGHRSRLQEPAARARREPVAGRDEASLLGTLTEIYRSGQAAQREGGANTLLLTIGTLLWCQKGKDAPYRAPIILIPVILERPSVRSGFSLRVHDDETRINTTLLEMLRQEFDMRFPTLEAERPPEDAAGVDVQGVFDTLRGKLRDVPGWEVTDDIEISHSQDSVCGRI